MRAFKSNPVPYKNGMYHHPHPKKQEIMIFNNYMSFIAPVMDSDMENVPDSRHSRCDVYCIQINDPISHTNTLFTMRNTYLGDLQ
ncbi:hypothetical protein Lspi_2329 [Legionella spiritensis]|uniref:Uncharacterized protein n=1 Tax=Legionella spiritensis TaxID=452 RepID=A0A0W0YYN4_LEGSP|nr:hypothetical protein Lspi_2329 [Legionella spiritensis]SNV38880.1 Uncharacterised protein [Legionella spiritensis]